jgi:hypothetical protein
VNQVNHLASRELAVGGDTGEMVAHLAQHIDRPPQTLAPGGIGRRPGLPGSSF